MGLKAAVQALRKAEKLKEKVQNTKDLLNDNEAWLCQQQLQRIYQQVLILDLEYALDRKVEQELWNHGFKNYIGTLQNLAKDKTNPKRSESQAMLSWCLEAASGFYLTLLQEICTAFDLNLPFRRTGALYGNKKLWHAVEHFSQPYKSSCYYICQHCLVHLGDIARYRNQSRQAESFYRHAVVLAPHSGQPYNQLALLEANKGDKLSTVFHYVRSVAVRHPFPAAATNLMRTITKCIDEPLCVEGRSKLSVSEYIALFLKVHGLLHTSVQLEKAEKYAKILTTTLTAHVSTESLTSWKLVQMLAINLFALHNSGGVDLDDSAVFLLDGELNKDEQRSKRTILHLVAGSLSAFLLPVYTLKEGDSLLEYFALPAIKVTLDWIRLEPHVLEDAAFSSRLQIWPSLCKLLNGLQRSLTDFVPDKYSYMPLPEDQDLLGFIPLEKCLNNFRCSHDSKLDPSLILKLRAFRLVEFGKWLASLQDSSIISCRDNDKTLLFEVVNGQQVVSSDLLRELEELTKVPSPVPSDTSSWGSSTTSASTPDLSLANFTSTPTQSPPSSLFQGDSLFERRSGILKPQGSLEKAREKEPTEAVWDEGPQPAIKRSIKNTTLETVLLKNSEQAELSKMIEGKQVTFKTPSPCNSPQTEEAPVSEAVSTLPAWPSQPKTFQSYEQNGSSTPAVFSGFHVPPPNMYNGQPMNIQPSPFEPWKDDHITWSTPNWWSRDPIERNQSQQGHSPSYFRNHVQQTTDVAANDVFSPHDISWSAHMLNLNLAQQIADHQHFYQAPQHVSGLDQEADVTQLITPDSNSKSDSSPGCNVETSSAFSSNSGQTGGDSMYSLFSNPAWNPTGGRNTLGNTMIGMPGSNSFGLGYQSFWSGPGPSPLERLLEQQKQLREGPAPKGGT